MTETNPYATPEANLQTDSSASGIAKVKEFPRFSAWGVFGLMFITLGIYGLYWLYTRTNMLNGKLPAANRIAKWIPIITIVCFIGYMFMSFSPLFFGASAPTAAGMFVMIGGLMSIVYMVVYLIWIFKFRSRLNLLSGAKSGEKFWLGGILTFFANAIYFQWKINQMHDHG